MPTLHLILPLRGLAQGQARVEAEGATLRQLLDALEGRYPGLRARLIRPDGGLREQVRLFVGDHDVRMLGGLEAPLEPGAEVRAIPVVRGGGLLDRAPRG
jgi:molybdopterin converting factor small subunit